METVYCLQPKEVVDSLFITDPVVCVKNEAYRIRIDPVRGAVVNIGYLNESTDSVLTDIAFIPDDLSHPPVIFDVLSDVLRILDKHKGPWSHRFQARCLRVCA